MDSPLRSVARRRPCRSATRQPCAARVVKQRPGVCLSVCGSVCSESRLPDQLVITWQVAMHPHCTSTGSAITLLVRFVLNFFCVQLDLMYKINPRFTAIVQVNLSYPAPPVKNWRIFLVQSFTARMPLLSATSAFELRRIRWSSAQQCYLRCLRTFLLYKKFTTILRLSK